MKKPPSRNRGQQPKKIEWSLAAASAEFGCSRETLRKGLRQNDIPVKSFYTTKEVFTALAGDLQYEKTRVERAKADRLERDNRNEDENWVKLDEVQKLITDKCGVIRPWFLGLAARLATALGHTVGQSKVVQAEVNVGMKMVYDELKR